MTKNKVSRVYHYQRNNSEFIVILFEELKENATCSFDYLDRLSISDIDKLVEITEIYGVPQMMQNCTRACECQYKLINSKIYQASCSHQESEIVMVYPRKEYGLSSFQDVQCSGHVEH